MGTFFEKLTGNGSRPSAIVDTAVAQAAKSETRQARKITPPPMPEEQKTTHLKVETDERSREPEPEAAMPEEEGELTVDIYDRGDTIVIQSTVAGVKPEDLDVSITNDSVSIRGRRERTEEVSEKDYYYKELFWGTFSRSVILPEEIEDDLAEASLKHGLLTIKLPKKRRGVVQKLKVKVS